MKTIVKVQRPVAVNHPDASLLIYDRYRTHISTPTPDLPTLRAMGPTCKAFFHAEWDGARWALSSSAPWQDW